MYPVILICGEAGSGKDTVSMMLADYLHGVCVAQADPMKRFAHEIFRFTPNQLWGPSEMRNAPDTHFASTGYRAEVLKRFEDVFTDLWLHDVFPQASETQRRMAYRKLSEWVADMIESAHKDGYLTPRKVLQTLGTEWGRNFSQDMWVDYALRVADKVLSGGHNYSALDGLQEEPNMIGAGCVIITDGRFTNELLKVKLLGGVALRVLDGSNCCKINLAEKAGVIGHRSEVEQRSIPRRFFDIEFVNNKSLGLEKCKDIVNQELVPLLMPSPIIVTF